MIPLTIELKTLNSMAQTQSTKAMTAKNENETNAVDFFQSDEQWAVHHGDCILHMLEDMPEESVDFSIYSPPFPAIYAYGPDPGDIGNVDSMGGEAAVHLSFMFHGLARVLKPGWSII